MSEVSIVGDPQCRDIAKRHVGVALPFHPALLVVAIEDDGAGVLRDEKSSMVVAGRIDEVAENLARAPLAGRRPRSGPRLVDVAKQIERRVDGAVQIGGDGGGGLAVFLRERFGSRLSWCRTIT